MSLSGRRRVRRWIWMETFARLDNQYEKLLAREIGGSCESLLDVGCGFNSPVQYLVPRPKLMVGIDAFGPVIESSKGQAIHDEYYVMDARQIDKQFQPNSFDCVLASDVIEHLREQDALELIRQMETIARKKVIIYTPNGFLAQSEEYGNPLQWHLSGWDTGRMTRLGYEVTGVQGLKKLRGPMAEIRWRPTRFWLAVSLLSQAFTTRLPHLAFRILCIKHLDTSKRTNTSGRVC